MIVGEGEYRYELVENWEQIPEEVSHPDVVAVSYCPDSADVFLFCRSPTPIIRYSKSGEYRDSWGAEHFTEVRGPHGMHLLGDGTMLLVDLARNCVERFRYDGTRLEVLAPPAEPTGQSGPAFDKPTSAALHRNGSTYITDGYGNSYLHRYGPGAGWLATWGEPGSGPLQFRIPHAVTVDHDGNLLVADRENHRIQVISSDGVYLREIGGVHRPCAVRLQANGDMIIPELGSDTQTKRLVDRAVPSRISVLRPDGSIAARFGTVDGAAPGNFVAAHDVCVDDEGSIYVAEVTDTMGVKRNLVAPGTHAIQKFVRV